MSIRKSKLIVRNSVSANPAQLLKENLVRDYASFDFGEFTSHFRLLMHVMIREPLLVSEDSAEKLIVKFYCLTKHFNLGIAPMQGKEIDRYFDSSLTEE